MIKFIFVPRFGSSGLAYDPWHRVIGLTLLPIDANPNLFFFINGLSLTGTLKKKTARLALSVVGWSDSPTDTHTLHNSYN